MALVLGVGGSPRLMGNSQALLEAILAGAAEAGAETEIILLGETPVNSCVGCEKCRRDKRCTRFLDAMQGFYSLLEKAKGLVLSSPVYNYNITAWMKAFIDRLYCYYDFTDDHPRAYRSRLAGQGRKAVVTVVGEQTDPGELGFALEALAMPLEPLGHEVIGRLEVPGMFQLGRVKQNEAVLLRARELGIGLARALTSAE